MRRALLTVVLLIVAASPAGAEPPWTGASISEVVPSIGRPAGGEIVRIGGRNFVSPVRVFFDLGGAQVEALPVSVSPTSIDIVTPAVLMKGQRMVTSVTVHSGAGAPSEQRVTAEGAFTYQKLALIPMPSVVSPNLGMMRGDTRVTIFGEGFQAPVQVLFRRDGFAPVEARVISVDFHQITLLVPEGTPLDGASGALIDIEIVNIHSNTRGVLRESFRYIPDPLIARITPSAGPAAGGTTLRIAGAGFAPPVEVTVAGIRAQVIAATPTEIVVKTGPAAVPRCGTLTGPIVLMNVVFGETVSGPSFTYVAPRAGCVEHDLPTRAEQ